MFATCNDKLVCIKPPFIKKRTETFYDLAKKAGIKTSLFVYFTYNIIRFFNFVWYKTSNYAKEKNVSKVKEKGRLWLS